MSKSDIDELDKRIISVLSKNSAVSYSTLADRVNTSRNTAYRRVKRLRNKGILLDEAESDRIVDISKLNQLGISILLVRLNVNAEDVDITGELLEDLEEVKMIMESYGKFNFILLLMLERDEERSYLRDLRNKMSDSGIVVNNLETSQITTLKKIDFSLPYPEK